LSEKAKFSFDFSETQPNFAVFGKISENQAKYKIKKRVFYDYCRDSSKFIKI